MKMGAKIGQLKTAHVNAKKLAVKGMQTKNGEESDAPDAVQQEILRRKK